MLYFATFEKLFHNVQLHLLLEEYIMILCNSLFASLELLVKIPDFLCGLNRGGAPVLFYISISNFGWGGGGHEMWLTSVV